MAEVDGPVADLPIEPQLPSASNEHHAQTTANINNPSLSPASLNDNGLSKRPRDSRLLHMILANLGVTAYQERVPLQLMDFAYRFTSSTLQDALHLTSESQGSGGHPPGAGRGAGSAANNDVSSVTLPSLRLSILSRSRYQFSPTLPKEVYQELSQERNRVALPAAGRDWGLRLPPEQFCLTGVGWALKDEWDSEGDEASKFDDQNMTEHAVDENGDEYGEEEDEEDQEGNEKMEDIFGESFDSADKDVHMDEE